MKTNTPIATAEEKDQDPVQADYQQGLQFLQDKNYSQAAMALHNALVGYEQQAKEEGIANANDKLGMSAWPSNNSRRPCPTMKRHMPSARSTMT